MSAISEWDGTTRARSPVLVHDYLLVMRGAERSFLALCDLWPQAPVATLLFDRDVFGARLHTHPIRTSRLQRLGLTQSAFKAALPVFPPAAERLDVSGHRLVISSSSAFAHGVLPDEGAVHLCYCYTPFRYAWYEQQRGVASAPAPLRPLVRASLRRIQAWDWAAAQRGTRYVAISKLSQERIARYWGVEAPIIHPPVQLGRFTPGQPEDFILVVCELVAHKQVDVALEAARRAGVKVKVVGGGVDGPRLSATYASGSCEFLGRVGDDQLAGLYARSRALVVPNVEEFGIAAVEAQASGRPVIAASGGGALETVIEGETGAFFRPGDVDELAAILSDPALEGFDPDAGVRSAARFSVERFQESMLAELRQAVGFPDGQPTLCDPVAGPMPPGL